MKMHLILNSLKVLCDKNPLFKIQSVLCRRLAINHSAGQFGLPLSAVMYFLLTENENVYKKCNICFKGLLVVQQPINTENSATIHCISMVYSN